MRVASTFFERIDHLSEQVGHGSIEAKVEVDQVYAHYQEVHPEFRHPQGGQAFYLRDGLYENMDRYMGTAAERLVTPEGSEIKTAMKDVSEHLSREVFERAPREWGDLRASGHPTVTDNGEVIYDRPPNVGRLSEEELRAKHRAGELFPFDRGVG